MRQLIIGNGVAPAYVAGVLAPGAIDVQKEDAATQVATSLLLADTIATAPRIRFVQGTPEGVNIYSQWINGRDITGWRGESYTAQTAQSTTALFANGPIVADGIATLKLISSNQGQQQFQRKSATINVTAGQTDAQVGLAIFTSLTGIAAPIAATDYAIIGADFAVAQIDAPNTTITFTGSLFNLTLGTELGSFRTASEGLDLSNGTDVTITAAAAPSLGYGDAQVLSQVEDHLKGNRSFYNRVQQPNTPPSYIDVATPLTYDVYSLASINATPGSIHGVDNKREFSVASNSAGGAPVIAAFEGPLNAWLLTCPGAFGPVNL